jgi:FtsZ-binding cell division protein ZapB
VATVSKVLVVDANKDIASIRNLTATNVTGTLQTAAQPNITSIGTLTGLSTESLTLNGTAVTSSAAELNKLTGVTTTTTELNKLTGVTALSAEINTVAGVTAGTVSAGKALVVDANKDIASIRNLTATNVTGTLQTASQPNITSVGTLTGLSTGSLTLNGIAVTSSAAELNKLTGVTALTAEINTVAGVTAGTVSAGKALVVDANKDIASIRNLTATNLTGTLQTVAQPNITSVGTLTGLSTGSLTLNGTAVTSSAAELNKLTGVTTTTTELNKLTGVTALTAEINTVAGVAAGTVSAGKALVVDANKDIASIRNLTATNLTGTLQTVAQPNITSVGTLTSLNVTGTISTSGSIYSVYDMYCRGWLSVNTTASTPLYPIFAGTGYYRSGTSSNFNGNNFRYYSYSSTSGTSSTATDVSIYAAYRIVASEFDAFSDRRIKTNIIDVDDYSALEILRLIEPKIYNYKDTVARSSEPVWGFIAQQINDVLPHAVNLLTDYIPNIMQLTNKTINNNGDIVLAVNNSIEYDDNNTGKIRLLNKEDKEIIVTIKEKINDKSFTINEILEENEYFIYGEEVTNFHSLDKQAIYTITTSALQEIDRELVDEKNKVNNLEHKVINLENENQQLKNQIVDILSRLQNLENK